jgi:hypothetical protein
MSRYDEPTQRVSRPSAPPAPLPGSLDPLREHERETGTGWVETPGHDEADHHAVEPASATGVLPLDQIFAEPPRAEAPTATAEAPTWTAMPVVPVRSEPMPMATTGMYDESAREESRRGSGIALSGAWDRLDAWFRRDDNGLMLLTALVACVLMVVVASVGP